MADNYTGDPSQTRSPSPQPQSDTMPVVQIPIDGELANRASIDQLAKVLADWVGFAIKPLAKGLDYVRPVQRWRTALGHTRAHIDHLGMPAGRILQLDEYWVDVPGAATTGSHGGLNIGRGWRYKGIQTTGTSRLERWTAGNGGGVNVHPQLEIAAGDTLDDYAEVNRWGIARLVDINHVVVDWEGRLDVTALTALEVGMGMGVEGGHASKYVRFYATAGDTHWRAQTHDGTSQTNVVTAVALATGFHRFRIEWHGADVSDNLARGCRFYINGALVATITATIPYNENLLGERFYARNVAGGTPATKLFIGPERFRASLYSDDVI